jgi:pimeloyl-ACP methyl ester carboxylesterase
MSDLIDLHKQLDGRADAVLIGHDWGCFTANGLAAYPGSPFGAYVSMPRTPVLVLHGEQDGAVQVGYLDGVIDAPPPGSRVQTIPGAGHFLQVDQPEAVCAAILGYLGID